MPHLTFPLQSDSPIIPLQVGISSSRRIVLQQQGKHAPAWVQINGLIDTGADCTCIEPSALQLLHIEPKSYVDVHTMTTTGRAGERSAV